jgi:hypothetical protein
LAEWHAAHPDDWPVRPEFHPDKRWYARIAITDTHEAWLLTWLPGQDTDLHDHGGSAGAFTILTGTLIEQVPGRGPQATLISRSYGVGGTRVFGGRHVHRIANTGPVPAISLHVYAPALTRMTRYRLDGGELRVGTVERAGANW